MGVPGADRIGDAHAASRRACVAFRPVSHPPTCSRCGRPRPDDQRAALTWVTEHDRRGVRWLCPDCARTHVRDIESKLDQDWW